MKMKTRITLAVASVLLAMFIAGCVTTAKVSQERTEIMMLVRQNRFQEARNLAVAACPEEVRGQIAVLVRRNQIQEARELLRKKYSFVGALTSLSGQQNLRNKLAPTMSGPGKMLAPGQQNGNPEPGAPGGGMALSPGMQQMVSKALQLLDLIEEIVIPAETAFAAERIRILEAQVQAALDKHDDDAARQAIYNYGTTGLMAVDSVTYLAKCAFLNSRVNPATLEKWERFAQKYVEGTVKAGEGAKALAAANRIPTVPIYPERIDDLIDESGIRAVEQQADEDRVEGLTDSVKAKLSSLVSTRTGLKEKPTEETWALIVNLAKLHNLSVPLRGFEENTDWRGVEERLALLRQALLEDDVSDEDADTLIKTLRDGFKALVSHNGLTTAELNKRLTKVREESLKKAEATYTADRIRTLEAQVQAALNGPGDDEARQVIYNFGITGRQTVDSVTFLAKCAYLNSRVNPLTLGKWEHYAQKNVGEAIKAGDFAKAADAAKRIPPVAAYPEKIDELIKESGVLAVKQHADKEGVDELTGKAKSALYALIAPRRASSGRPEGIRWRW